MKIITNNFYNKLFVIVLGITLCTTGLSLLPSVRADYPVDMISYWKLDETSGITAFDSCNGNDGTLGIPPWNAPGIVNTALSFDGIDDRIEIPDSASLHVSTFTVMAWTKATGKFGTYRSILSKDKIGQSEFWFGYANTNKLDFKFNGQSGSNINGASQRIITDTDWHFLVGVYDGSTIMVYIDGMLDGSKSYGPMTVDSGTVNMGFTRYWGDNFFQGVLDEVAIFNIVLTPTEIMNLYTRGLAGQNYLIPPTADFIYTPNNPTDSDVIQFTDLSTDTDGMITSWSWNFGDGDTSALQNPIHQYTDSGTYQVMLTVTDDDGGSTEYTTTTIVTVSNVAPIITDISVSAGVIAKGSSTTFTATFTDPDIDDSHITTIDWGDGTSTTIDPVDGYTITSSHLYTTPDVYTITITVTDDDGGTDTEVFQYVVVYDPSAGFVTGGGSINSPEGAYQPDPSLTGIANFGFVSKYKKGQQIPDGNTEFQFEVADLNFHSVSYEWLIVTGPKAIFKGTGTINGAGNYGFKLFVIDGQLNGGGGIDKFRIKIWDKDNNDIIVYDNNIGVPDDQPPTTQLGSGQVVIHKA